MAAPWIDSIGGPKTVGRLTDLVAPSGIAKAELPEFLQLFDRAYANLSAGTLGAANERYLVVSNGPLLGSGQLVIPTGVVEVERRPDGESATVRVVKLFGGLKLGQGLIPIPVERIPEDVEPEPELLGVGANVVWIADRAIIPSIADYVILDATHMDGVAAGDRFTVLLPRRTGSAGTILPEEPIALLKVVRVTDRGTTAVLVAQRHPALHVGSRAKLTAKMP
jgi:hypothetical protein